MQTYSYNFLMPVVSQALLQVLNLIGPLYTQ